MKKAPLLYKNNRKCMDVYAILFSVAGGWSDWSTWSTCDAMCGVGTSQRRRDCTNPVPSATGSFCLGDPVEYKSCQGSFAGT